MVNATSNLFSPFSKPWFEELEYPSQQGFEYPAQQEGEYEPCLTANPGPELLDDYRPLTPLSPLSSSSSQPPIKDTEQFLLKSTSHFAPEILSISAASLANYNGKKISQLFPKETQRPIQDGSKDDPKTKELKRKLAKKIYAQNYRLRKKQLNEHNKAKEQNNVLTQSLDNSPNPETLKAALRSKEQEASLVLQQNKLLKEELNKEKALSREKDEINQDKINELSKSSAAEIADLEMKLAWERSSSRSKDKIYAEKIAEFKTRLEQEKSLPQVKNKIKEATLKKLQKELNLQRSLSQVKDKIKEDEINDLKKFFNRKIADLTGQLQRERFLLYSQSGYLLEQEKTISDLKKELSNLQKETSS